MSQSSDGLINGTPFFQSSPAGMSARAGKPSVLGPAAQSILRTETGELPSSRGSTMDRIAQERPSQNSPFNAQMAQKEKFLQGMQVVASGKAVSEVAEEQPWYTRIFGKSDVVLGAEAYAKGSLAQEVTADVLRNMGTLRQMDEDTFRKALLTRFEMARTGSAAVDMDVQNQLLQKVPSIMETYTKQAYQYRQEQAAEQQKGFFHRAADTLGETFKNLDVDPTSPSGQEAAAKAVAEFDANIGRIIGQDEESYKQNLLHLFEGAIAQIGEPQIVMNTDGTTSTTYKTAHAVQAILAGSKVFEQLPREQQTALLAKAELANRKALTKFSTPYMEKLAKIETLIRDPGPKDTVPKLIKAKQEILDSIQRESGSFIPLYDPEDMKADSVRSAMAIQARRERELQKYLADQAAKARKQAHGTSQAAKEEAAQLRAAQFTNLMVTDPVGWSRVKALGLVKAEEAKAVENNAYVTATPDQQYALMRGSLNAIPVAKAERQGEINRLLTEDPKELAKRPDELMFLLERYKQDVQALGREKAQDYYGADMAGLMETTATRQAQGFPVDILVHRLHADARAAKSAKPSEDLREATKDQLQKSSNRWGISALWNDAAAQPLWASGTNLDDYPDLTEDVASEVARAKAVNPADPEERMILKASQNLVGPGKAYVPAGSFLIRNYSDGQDPLQYLVNPPEGRGIPVDKVGEFLEEQVEALHKGQVHSIQGFYSGGPSKSLAIRVLNEDGSTNVKELPLDELLREYHNPTKGPGSFKRAAKKATGSESFPLL